MRLLLTTCLLASLVQAQEQRQSDNVISKGSYSSSSPLDGMIDETKHLRHLSKCRSSKFGECGSDCNSDCDCTSGLVCYHREEGTSKFFDFGGARDLTIPGCAAAKDLFNDYCINPTKFPAKTLWYVGSNGRPSNVFPLKECWGDCDKDSDCETGLTCFKGEGSTTVPGCTGTVFRGIDYCYKAPTPKPPTKAPTKAPVKPPTKAPTKRPTKAPTKAPAGMGMSMSMGRERTLAAY